MSPSIRTPDSVLGRLWWQPSRIRRILWRLAIAQETKAQDLVEYALLAGFIAVAVGALFPNLSASYAKIYSRLASKLIEAGG